MFFFGITCTDKSFTIRPGTCIKKIDRVNFDFMLTVMKYCLPDPFVSTFSSVSLHFFLAHSLFYCFLNSHTLTQCVTHACRWWYVWEQKIHQCPWLVFDCTYTHAHPSGSCLAEHPFSAQRESAYRDWHVHLSPQRGDLDRMHTFTEQTPILYTCS